MKALSFLLFVFLLAAISFMDYRLTSHVHAALMLPAGLITIAFLFVREKKSSLLVLSALILILSFSKRNAAAGQASTRQFKVPAEAALVGR